jgi:hypothetical protein
MRSFQTSRFLNEKSGFMGLSPLDFAGLGYALVIFHSVLSKFGVDILAFVLVAVLGYGLVSVRLRFRKKVIRDFLTSQIQRWGAL